MQQLNELIKVSYYDLKAETRVECYADTLVVGGAGQRGSPCLISIRLGGYPESVKAMSDAIFGGGTIWAAIDGKEKALQGLTKQYERKYGHDGLYAEAVLKQTLTSMTGDENCKSRLFQNSMKQRKAW